MIHPEFLLTKLSDKSFTEGSYYNVPILKYSVPPHFIHFPLSKFALLQG